MKFAKSFATRLTIALGILLLTYGALVALLGRQFATAHQQETLQRVSYGLARNIIEHWPQQITLTDPDESERATRAALMSMLMTVNPGVQVYVLNADGRVADYIGEPGMVRESQVDLTPIRQFLAGARPPLHGTDPMGSGIPRIFSAAMFPPVPGATRPPGYLYVVLDGHAATQAAAASSLQRAWQSAGLVALLGLLATFALGAYVFRRLTQPLQQLAVRMREYRSRVTSADLAAPDEVQAIGTAFNELVQRVETQNAREQQQNHAHREMMASVAHDLRTPLTALHGQLEALANDSLRPDVSRERILSTALAQSDKVRRLSQQLFELAALQSTDQVLHRERFYLDELVSDVVQKFTVTTGPLRVTLDGAAPGRVPLDADMQLVERALTNLIDNAVRHAPGFEPIRVSVRHDGAQADVFIEDTGPGLPIELAERLERGQSVRDPPIKRTSGGIGGLGLAIAQRVAVLHGGSLRPCASARGGTSLCLALPMAPGI